jgi:hypothetical protein
MLTVSAVLVAALAATAVAGDGRRDDGRDDDEHEGYAIGLWGDLPYNDVKALTGRSEPDRRHESTCTSSSRSTTAT